MEPYRRPCAYLGPSAFCMLRVFSASNNCPGSRALGPPGLANLQATKNAKKKKKKSGIRICTYVCVPRAGAAFLREAF